MKLTLDQNNLQNVYNTFLNVYIPDRILKVDSKEKIIQDTHVNENYKRLTETYFNIKNEFIFSEVNSQNIDEIENWCQSKELQFPSRKFPSLVSKLLYTNLILGPLAILIVTTLLIVLNNVSPLYYCIAPVWIGVSISLFQLLKGLKNKPEATNPNEYIKVLAVLNQGKQKNRAKFTDQEFQKLVEQLLESES